MASALAEHSDVAASSFQMMARAQIEPSPLNPRKHFDQAKLVELAATMGNGVGIIEPLVVRPRKTGSRGATFEIVAGERRWRAAALAGLEEVPVITKTLTDAQVLEIMVIENDQREDINPLEEGDGFKRLMTFGFDIDKLAGRIGRSRKYVYDRVKLLELVPDAKTLLLDGRITAGHAILIARLTPEQQQRVIDVDDVNDPRAPLFEHEAALLTPAGDDELERAQRANPYTGMKTRSVRELQAWIDQHCRFDAAAPVSQELFPATVAAVEEAKKVIFITHNHYVDPDAKDGNTQRIYSCVSWKRADGTQKSKTCDRSVTGVLVVGPGRGEAFEVCVHKECQVHWKAEKKKAARAASTGSQLDWKKRQEADQARWKREREEAERLQAQWKVAMPAVLEACAVKVKALPVSKLAEELLAGYERPSVSRASALIGKGKTADDALRLLLMTSLLDEAESYQAGSRFPALAKKTIGLDVKPLLKKAQAATPLDGVTQRGTCRYCDCTESTPCIDGDGAACAWLDEAETVCSSPVCRRKHEAAQDKQKRAAKKKGAKR